MQTNVLARALELPIVGFPVRTGAERDTPGVPSRSYPLVCHGDACRDDKNCAANFALISRFGLSAMTPFARLLQYVEQHSRLGIICVVIWLAIHRPFWRHFFMAASAMSFATLLLPEEMMFFTRHPLLALGVLFTVGFAGAHLGRTKIGTLATWIVLGVLAVPICRAILEA